MPNRLFDALPGDVRRLLEPHLTHVSLGRGEVLHQPGEKIRDLYFPLDALVSITITMGGGRTAETGVAGNRELVGVNAFMGGSETTQTEYVIQIDGRLMKVAAEPLLKAFDKNKAVRDVVLKYTQAMIAQISQNAACNRLHKVQQRYARWLLEVRDRIQTDDLRLTQEFTGEMLGVRRATVTQAALKLQAKGLIKVTRGGVRIRDAESLEGVSCECFRVLQDEYDRLLGPTDRP
ncbi:MAG TPA: Crp/Fnr family transcriptional regulator [Thermoanaerobaculia bacterium]|nr:Crp/Fnr family transcriptional regulator [Thermoanaerobaculia bacterium]